MSKESYSSIVLRAEEAWNSDRYELAADIYLEIDKKYVINTLIQQEDLAIDIAYTLRYAGRPRKAIDFAEQMLADCKSSISAQKRLQLHLAIAECLSDIGIPQKSIEHLLAIKQYDLDRVAVDLRVRILRVLANAYCLVGEYDQCLPLIDKALCLLDTVDQEYHIIERDCLLGIKAHTQRALGRLGLALKIYQERLQKAIQSNEFTDTEIFERKLDVIFIKSIHHGKSETWEEEDEKQFSDIVQHIQVKIASSIEAKTYLAPSYNSIIPICIDLIYIKKYFQLAIDLLKGMYQYHKKVIGHNFGLAKATTLLGESYLSINNIEDAKACGRESYDLTLETLLSKTNPDKYTDGDLIFAGRIAKFLKNINMIKESRKINKILKKYGSISSKKPTP